MKQKEIDSWVRRQTRMHSQAHAPTVNWVLIVSVLIVVGTLVFIVFKVAGVL